jgi:CRISPR-associated protein Cmr4
MNNVKLTFVHALSPLHAGTGQGVGVIDLPIAREKATGIPYLAGSSLKGTLRDQCPDRTPEEKRKKKAVFGPDTSGASEHAGSAQFSDLRLLLLPVRSLKGTFAWVTSPFLLHRLVREAGWAGLSDPCFTNIPQPAETECFVATGSGLTLSKRVYLEDLDLDMQTDPAINAWALWLGDQLFAGDTVWRTKLKERLCIVSDDILDFLLDTATEINARIKLVSDKKTVQSGGLWYEEALPAETVLTGLLVETPVKESLVNAGEVFSVVRGIIKRNDKSCLLQFGGKATVGKGLCYVQLTA